MAFGAKQISPIDFEKSVAVGVNLPFSAAAVFKSNYTTKESIKYNLINYFLTNPGERPLNPNFGAGLRAFIFEQITSGNTDYLKNEIESKLTLFFNNITIQNLDILKQEDNNNITVFLTYSINNTGETDTINLDFQ
jgi:phage baseplate assembly protein W|tara:strand:- start:132 stop:539 length:408 start_codon:yes stop_codon:yes gene_type:complete